MFENVNTRSILNEVPTKLKGDAPRSLWRRIESEFSSGAGSSVSSYLNSEFDEIQTRLRAALKVLND